MAHAYALPRGRRSEDDIPQTLGTCGGCHAQHQKNCYLQPLFAKDILDLSFVFRIVIQVLNTPIINRDLFIFVALWLFAPPSKRTLGDIIKVASRHYRAENDPMAERKVKLYRPNPVFKDSIIRP